MHANSTLPGCPGELLWFGFSLRPPTPPLAAQGVWIAKSSKEGVKTIVMDLEARQRAHTPRGCNHVRE